MGRGVAQRCVVGGVVVAEVSPRKAMPAVDVLGVITSSDAIGAEVGSMRPAAVTGPRRAEPAALQ